MISEPSAPEGSLQLIRIFTRRSLNDMITRRNKKTDMTEGILFIIFKQICCLMSHRIVCITEGTRDSASYIIVLACGIIPVDSLVMFSR